MSFLQIKAFRSVHPTSIIDLYGMESYGKLDPRFVKLLIGFLPVPLARLKEARLQVNADSPPTINVAHARLANFKNDSIPTLMENMHEKCGIILSRSGSRGSKR